MILTFSQICGILLRSILWLKISVRAPMATGPMCFKCQQEMASGPVDPVDLVLSITALVMLRWKEKEAR